MYLEHLVITAEPIECNTDIRFQSWDLGQHAEQQSISKPCFAVERDCSTPSRAAMSTVTRKENRN